MGNISKFIVGINKANYSLLDIVLLSATPNNQRQKLETLIAREYPVIKDGVPDYPVIVERYKPQGSQSQGFQPLQYEKTYSITPKKPLTKNSINAFDIAFRIANPKQGFDYVITNDNKLYALAMVSSISRLFLNNSKMETINNNTINQSIETRLLASSIIGYLYIASCFERLSTSSQKSVGVEFLTSLYSLLDDEKGKILIMTMQNALRELGLEDIADSLESYVKDILY